MVLKGINLIFGALLFQVSLGASGSSCTTNASNNTSSSVHLIDQSVVTMGLKIFFEFLASSYLIFERKSSFAWGKNYTFAILYLKLPIVPFLYDIFVLVMLSLVLLHDEAEPLQTFSTICINLSEESTRSRRAAFSCSREDYGDERRQSMHGT